MAAPKTLNTVNGIDMDILHETVGKIQREPEMGKSKFRVNNKWINGDQNCSTVSDFVSGNQQISHKTTFKLCADEPAMLAGQDKDANPVEYLLSSLASCVTTSIVAHAAVNGINIEELESQVEGDIDIRGFLGLAADVPKGFSNIRIKFKVKADTDDMEKLKKFAQFSPVYNTITKGAKVDVQIEPK